MDTLNRVAVRFLSVDKIDTAIVELALRSGLWSRKDAKSRGRLRVSQNQPKF